MQHLVAIIVWSAVLRSWLLLQLNKAFCPEYPPEYKEMPGRENGPSAMEMAFLIELAHLQLENNVADRSLVHFFMRPWT